MTPYRSSLFCFDFSPMNRLPHTRPLPSDYHLWAPAENEDQAIARLDRMAESIRAGIVTTRAQVEHFYATIPEFICPKGADGEFQPMSDRVEHAYHVVEEYLGQRARVDPSVRLDARTTAIFQEINRVSALVREGPIDKKVKRLVQTIRAQGFSLEVFSISSEDVEAWIRKGRIAEAQKVLSSIQERHARGQMTTYRQFRRLTDAMERHNFGFEDLAA